MAKLNPDLVGEMTWPECVFAASTSKTKTVVKDPDGDDERIERFATWDCSACSASLTLDLVDDIKIDAQTYLDKGWGYVRTREAFLAKCKNCRSHKA